MRYSTAFAALVLFATTSACNRAPSSNAATAPAAAPAQSAPPAASPVAAAPSRPVGNAFTGAVAETMDSGGYTYMRLTQPGHDDVWAAAPQFDAKVGESVSVSLDMPMQDFQSRTLNRTFPILYFVQEVGRNGQAVTASAAPSAPALMTAHGAGASAPVVQKIEPPANGLSVADVFAKKASLSGKPVTVRGTVVKFNGGILDRNWLHIQDGSGSADARNNDLTLTTDAAVKVGDVVTMTGVVGLNKDFGSGYAYDVMVEKATLAK